MIQTDALRVISIHPEPRVTDDPAAVQQCLNKLDFV